MRFVLVALGGTGIGLAVGWLAASLQRRLDDPPVQVTISLLTPFAGYIPTERLQVSGVLAAVASGLFLGWRVLVWLLLAALVFAQNILHGVA